MLKVYSICIPGLLQTRDYASMIIAGMAPRNNQEQHERLVDIRLQRQAVLDDVRGGVEPLRLQVVLDEAALYRGTFLDELSTLDLHARAFRFQSATLVV